MSGTQLVIMAVIMGLMYWIARGMIGGYLAFSLIVSPIVVGVVVDSIHGGLIKGLIIGGDIAAAFAGIIAPGGNLLMDSAPATTTVIPIALATGLTAEQAMTLAAPMGPLGSFVTNLRRMVNVTFVHRADEFAARGNLSGIARCVVAYPPLIEIPLLFLPVFLIVMFEQGAMLTFMNSVPSWAMHGLEVADGVMPAIGFALIMSMIGKPRMTPYTIPGSIVVKAVGLNTLTAGLVAGCVTVLVVPEKREREKEGVQKMAEERKTSPTKRDVNCVIVRWYITTEMSPNYERMQPIAYTYVLTPALKKSYPNKEDMIPALQRHLELSNTNATAGGLILGATLAMEEEKANNPDTIPSESIVAVKTGLMGSIAALGDSFGTGTITALFILASCPLVQGGSITGFWLLLLGTMYTFGELIIFIKVTYAKGCSTIKDIISNKLISNIIEGANILGTAMTGVLTVSIVNLAVAITANFDEATLSVQEKIDGIMPGTLSTGVLFIYCHLASKKHISAAELAFFTIAIALSCAVTGLL